MSDVTVQDVMTRMVVMFSPAETIHEAARRLARNKISGAPVVEKGKPVGMVSEADLIRAVLPPHIQRKTSILDTIETFITARPHPDPGPMTVADVMSRPVVRIAPNASIWRAAEVMDRTGLKRLPVVDEDDFLVGILSRADLVKAMAKDDASIARDAVVAIFALGEENFESLQVESHEGILVVAGRADRRTTHDLAIRIAARVPGVVEVVDHLRFGWDDTEPTLSAPKDPRFDWNKNLAGTEVAR